MTDQQPEHVRGSSSAAGAASSGFHGLPFTEFKPRQPSVPLGWGITLLVVAGLLLTLGGINAVTEVGAASWNAFLGFGLASAAVGALLTASGISQHCNNVEYLVHAEIDRRRTAGE